MSSCTELDSLHLEGFTDKAKPITPRLKDVKSALAVYTRLRQADEKSSVNRARIDAMFDGAPPYDTSRQIASGQQNRINLNFGQAMRLLDVSLSAFVDLYSSLETLVEVRGRFGELTERLAWESTVSREITHLLRSWPEFHSNYLRLCTTFIKHGVGVAFFDTPEDWRFRVGGFQDILIPRQAPASEAAIDIAVGRRSFLTHELYGYIKDPNVATSSGWNVREAQRILLKNVRTTGRTNTDGSVFSDYEALQAEFKNNDISIGAQNPEIAILHFWVREHDGSVSHMICAEDAPEDFLYRKPSRFKSPEQAYIFFTFGVGSNGTYHSIRGLGQRIHTHIQTSNRLRCQFVEGAMLSSQAILQPENQRALDELQFTTYGPFSVLSPGVSLVERQIPNLANAVQPALQDLTMQLELNTDTVSPYTVQQGRGSSPYRNETQVVADLDVATRLSGATLNLFYASWNRLLREVVRRIVGYTGKDPLVADFRSRLREAGVPDEFLKTLDLARTRAVRSIGNGSAANRLVALRELQQIAGNFDDLGRHNLYRDIAATRVGHDLADRYIPERLDPRPTIDVKVAMLENPLLMRGEQVEVVSSELHGTHLEQHLPLLEQLIQQSNEEGLDVEALPTVQALYQHIAQHAQEAAADPALMGLAASIKKLLNFAEEIIHNLSKEQQARARQEAEGATGDEGAALNERQQLLQLRIQEHEAKQQMSLEKAQLEMSLKREKFEQERSLKDAAAALKAQKESLLLSPAS